MSPWMRRVGIGVGSVTALIVVAAGYVLAASSSKAGQTFDVPTTPITVVSDSLTIARGQHLATAIGKCVDCHGDDLAGRTFIDSPAIGTASGPNLTRGVGGVTAAYSDAELERVIRHGVKRDGHSVFVMPADNYQAFSDEDVAAIIAYIRSVPAVNRASVPLRLGPVGRMLIATGKLPAYTANQVEHHATHPASVAVDSSVAYGGYIAVVGGCTGCHGPGLSGGPVPGLPPDAPPAANLTPTGLTRYTDAQLETILRVGQRPDHSQVNDWMPWKATALMTSVEMTAIIKYLRTVAPREFGHR